MDGNTLASTIATAFSRIPQATLPGLSRDLAKGPAEIPPPTRRY